MAGGGTYFLRQALRADDPRVSLCGCWPNVSNTDVQSVARKIFDIGPRHRSVEQRFAEFFFSNKHKPCDLGLSPFVPHEDLYDILVELLLRVLARYLEFVCAMRFLVQYVNFLI